MIRYKIFVDKYGTLMEEEDFDEVKKVYDYNVESKKDGVGKFVGKKIYFMKVDGEVETELMNDESENDGKFLLGGDVVVHSLNKNLVNRYINDAPFDPKIMDRSEGYYENGELFLGEDSLFVKSVSTEGNVFIIHKSALKDKGKIAGIIDCMKKQGVNFKVEA